MTLKLEAKTRKYLRKKVALLRQSGKIPAVIYGHKKENQNLEINYIEFEKILNKAGENTLIDLIIDDNSPVKVIIADIQREPIKNHIIHVDLYQINMKEKIKAKVPIEFTGESKAVKEEGGVLIHNISEVEIYCLPENLIHQILVDITPLETFDDVITIKDLKIPANIEVLHHKPDDIVVLVARPKEEKEEITVTTTSTENETTSNNTDNVETTETEKK